MPKIKLPDWRKVALHPAVAAPQTMLMKTEQQLLYSLARDYFKAEGCIVDGGCFLGGSTVPLALGARDNPRFAANPRKPIVHSYDLFVVEPWTIGIYFPVGTPLGTSFQAKFENNIRDVSDLVKVNAGDVMLAELPQEPIEILFIDLAKHWTVNDYIVQNFFSRLIPGHSIVIQQDYLFHTWTGWLPVTMEYFAEYFEIVDHTEQNSVAFFYHTEIPPEKLQVDVIASLSRSQMYDLANQNIKRFSGLQREILIQSRDQFQEMLAAESWR
jgi:hypothetical protein